MAANARAGALAEENSEAGRKKTNLKADVSLRNDHIR